MARLEGGVCVNVYTAHRLSHSLALPWPRETAWLAEANSASFAAPKAARGYDHLRMTPVGSSPRSGYPGHGAGKGLRNGILNSAAFAAPEAARDDGAGVRARRCSFVPSG